MPPTCDTQMHHPQPQSSSSSSTAAGQVGSSPSPEPIVDETPVIFTEEEISNGTQAVRERLLQYVSGNPDDFLPIDIEWMLNGNLRRYVICSYLNEDEAFDLIVRTLTWRKESQISTLTDAHFPREFFKKGGLFIYERDLNDTPLLYMRVKGIRKCNDLDDLVKLFIAYQISKIDTQSAALFSWGILFDCTDIGFANVQIDLIRFLITVLKDYFPCGIKYVIVYELPWILNTVQKLIFAMIPDDCKHLIKFTNRKNITSVVPTDKLPDYMGGSCKKSYKFSPSISKPFDSMYTNRFNKDQMSRIRKILQELD